MVGRTPKRNPVDPSELEDPSRLSRERMPGARGGIPGLSLGAFDPLFVPLAPVWTVSCSLGVTASLLVG